MATIKIRVLTDACMKWKRDGQQYFHCTGLTTESEICNITAWNENQKTHLSTGNTIIIKNYCNVSKWDTYIFVRLNQETTVSYCLFSNMVRCSTVVSSDAAIWLIWWLSHLLALVSSATTGMGRLVCFAPVATVRHGQLPSSSVKCHFWQGCDGVPRCMPHHPIFLITRV